MRIEDVVNNVKVYGLEESITASKYPFAIDVSECNSDITKTVTKLAQSPKGSGEDTFLQGIIVQFDLTLPNKVWVEAERYHFFDFVSSMSTMHRSTHLDMDKQCNEYVYKTTKNLLKEDIEEYQKNPSEELFLKIIYNIPAGYRLTARMTTNYRQLKTIYSQRRKHRLPDWRVFCQWIETLPHSEFITGSNDNG